MKSDTQELVDRIRVIEEAFHDEQVTLVLEGWKRDDDNKLAGSICVHGLFTWGLIVWDEVEEKTTKSLAKVIHDELDDMNGNEGDLCLFCKSTDYDGNGIIHKDSCLILKLRKAMESGKFEVA